MAGDGVVDDDEMVVVWLCKEDGALVEGEGLG